MAELKDLNYDSIIDMSNDEAIERLRQIRLSRRTAKPSKKKSTPTKTAKAKPTPKMTAAQAAELLKILGEE
jgi:hypothetical protein